jgi:hypothetical protein
MRFEQLSTATSKLWDFGWFDVTRVRVVDGEVASAGWRSVLHAFFADPICQRRFCSQPDPWGAGCGHHGPFLAEQVNVDWWQPIQQGALATRLLQVLRDPRFAEPPSEEQSLPALTWAAEVEAAKGAMAELLAPADPRARLDWANMVWVVFHEFVWIRENGDELAVAVVGYD